MEETIKYFQPDITDLRVGYECEVKWHTYGDGINWRSYIVKAGDSILTTDNVRVPYLTKEQIEAEGWKPANTGGLENGCMNGRCAFTKGNYFLIIPSQPNTKLGNRIEIVMVDVLKDDYNEWTSNGRMYLGECRCINDFRLIMKLLCIK